MKFWTPFLCFVGFIFIISGWIHVFHISMSIRNTFLAPGQPCYCPSSRGVTPKELGKIDRYMITADSRFAPSHWETALLCNDVSYWLGVSLESALHDHGKIQRSTSRVHILWNILWFNCLFWETWTIHQGSLFLTWINFNPSIGK